MKDLRIMVVGCCAALLMAGCSGLELQKAERTTASGSEFSKELHANYLDLSREEYAEGDYGTSDTFALRASASAAGNVPEPEEVATRELPKDKVGELTDARSRLMAALAAGAREKAPKQAAHAQAMFDCWMEEQQEKNQADEVARCRSGFMASLDRVEASLKPAPVATRAPMPKEAAPAKQRFVVYFPFDSSKITPQSKQVILSAIDAAKAMGAKQVGVYGHTDTVGSSHYNMGLSEKRSESVAKLLTAGGIKAGEMNLGAFGDTIPAIPTGKGVKMPKNRRVVIELSK